MNQIYDKDRASKGMGHDNLKVRHNIMNVNSLQTFANIKGSVRNGCKDVYFVRVLGSNAAHFSDIENMDKILTERMLNGQGRYFRIDTLPVLSAIEDVQFYSACYDEWARNGRRVVNIKNIEGDGELKNVLGNACNVITTLFQAGGSSVNNSMEKNFVVKILYWIDNVTKIFLENWTPSDSMKFAISNISKKHEYLFCYLLTLLGIDVILLQCRQDIESLLEGLNLSFKYQIGGFVKNPLPGYDFSKYQKRESRVSSATMDETVSQRPVAVVDSGAYSSEAGVHRQPVQERRPVVSISRPDRDRNNFTNSNSQVNYPQRNNSNQEMSFEELAQLASSVVMIAIHDRNGQIIGTGSGIMIGRSGYILTNHHVASGGMFYSVRIENDDQIYKTDEIIKYNAMLDLAIIRINRSLQPLPFYKGQKNLVRGQKVVAIGSPLGLFNSVSDGIIAGFRQIHDVDMIQFTAPISHGSSGGAVLNMYGEVIGISTAGIDDGQNINLAVGYEYINTFIRGFN